MARYSGLHGTIFCGMTSDLSTHINMAESTKTTKFDNSCTVHRDKTIYLANIYRKFFPINHRIIDPVGKRDALENIGKMAVL